MSSLSYDVRPEGNFDEVRSRLESALKAEGFGILTEIDVPATLKEKIGAEFRPYRILGVCNPKLAHKALSHSAEVGLMLPCNVTLEEDPAGGVTVRIIDPQSMIEAAGMSPDPVLGKVADAAAARLRRVAESL